MNVLNHWLTKSPPFCLGHRGFPSMARENTLPSFMAALEAGAHGVELDVHVTRNGIPVVHHDGALWTGNKELGLAQLGWEELESLEFQEGETSYRVPSLAYILDEIGSRAMVNVEIKTPLSGRAAFTVEKTLAVISSRPHILVSSFDPEILGLVQGMDETIPLGFLFSSPQDLELWPDSPPVFALHPRKDCVTPTLMEGAKERHQQVNVWTVDTAEEAEALINLGVDGIITNRPDRITPALGAA